MALSQVPPELMGQLPPGVDAADAVKNPEGDGYWIVGRDGGVFAVGGAPFLGAYTTLAPADRQGERSFTHIIESSGGYSLVSGGGELYRFGEDRVEVPPPVALAPASTVAADAQKESSKVWLKGQLDQVGLGELAGWAIERFTQLGSTEGAGNAVLMEMKNQPLYQQKFPGMALREKAGLSPITEKQYMEWTETSRQIMKDAGLPEKFYDDPSDFADLIGVKDIAPTELKDRVTKGYAAMMSSPIETRNEMQRLWGVTEGELAAFFLDPKVGQEAIERRVAQAQIAGAAQMKKFGDLTIGETERLDTQGVTGAQAQAGFSLLGEQSELLEGSVSEGGDITREQQLTSITQGGDDARAAIKKRGKQRTATFEGGGTFAAGQQGVSGLGSGS